MSGKSCFFIGHRETSEEIYPALYAAVEQHILEYGVTEFIVADSTVLQHQLSKKQSASIQRRSSRYCYHTIRWSGPFQLQMDLTAPSIHRGWKASRARSQS